MKKSLMCLVGMLLVLIVALNWKEQYKEKVRFDKVRAVQQTDQQMQMVQVILMQYSGDHNGKLPPMQNTDAAQKAMQPYSPKFVMERGINGTSVLPHSIANAFASPITKQPFVFNARLSGRPLSSLSNQDVLFYDAAPLPSYNDPNGLYRSVAYKDLVKSMSEDQWQREKKRVGLP